MFTDILKNKTSLFETFLAHRYEPIIYTRYSSSYQCINLSDQYPITNLALHSIHKLSTHSTDTSDIECGASLLFVNRLKSYVNN